MTRPSKNPATAATVRGYGRSVKEIDVNQRTCNGCNASIPAPNLGRGRWPRWCSEQCRADAQERKRIERLLALPVCSVEECNRKARSYSASHCETHYYRLRRQGTVEYIGQARIEDPAYRTVHARLQRDRGPASGHSCVDCGQPAQDWSYDHGDPDQRIAADNGCPYSTKAEHYQPRCKRCHAIFDNDLARTA